MVAQEKDVGNKLGAQGSAQQGQDLKSTGSGTDFTLHGFSASPAGDARASGFSFRGELQRKLAGAIPTRDVGGSPIDQFAAPSIFNLPRPGGVQAALEELGIQQISGAARFGSSPAAGISVAGEGFNSALRIEQEGAAWSYAGLGAKKFSEFLSAGKVSITRVTLSVDGREVQITPTVTTELFPGISVSATTALDDVFSRLQSATPMHDHILSGSPLDPEAGVSSETGRFLFNQYTFTDMPGSSVFTMNYLPHHGMSNVSLILGAMPSLGNFLGMRSTLEAEQHGRVLSPVGQYDELNPFSKLRPALISAQGDILSYQKPDGTFGVAGVLSVERDAKNNSVRLKLQLDRNLGLFGEPQGGPAFDNRPDWTTSLLLEAQWGGSAGSTRGSR